MPLACKTCDIWFPLQIAWKSNSLLAPDASRSHFQTTFEGEAAHTIKYHFICRKFLRALADYPSIQKIDNKKNDNKAIFFNSMPLVPGKKVTNILEIDKVTMLRSIQIHLITNKKNSPLSTRSREALLFDEEFGSYYAKIIK